MDINEAISHAQNMKNQFRAFAKLEEVLREMAAQTAQIQMKEQTIAELDARRKQLAEEIEGLTEDLSRASDAHNDAMVRMEQEHKDWQARNEAEKAALAGELAKVRQALGEEQTAFANQRDKHVKEITDLENKRRQAERALEELRKSI